jgi:nucleoside-diphosphate-sugar epimerase
MSTCYSASLSAVAVLCILLFVGDGANGFSIRSRPSNILRQHGLAHSSRSSALRMSSALIVQNKGGGHGELGYQLAKKLSRNPQITSITILQDSACNDSKEPFKSYAVDLPDVTVIKAPLADESMTASELQSVLGTDASFTYVWDNASKGPVGAGKAICDCAKLWGSKLFTYVSSAGIYKPQKDAVFPMSEATTPVKPDAGQAMLESYAVDIGLPLVSFRPQYIYGPKANKHDYIDWYFDRLVRELPLPIPGDGHQKVSLTHSEDVASLVSILSLLLM